MPKLQQPELSVVIPSVNGWGDLERCLAALHRQEGDVALEVIVVDRIGELIRGWVRDRYPTVRLLEAPAGTTIPALRALAFDAACAPVIGVIEDHVIVPPQWARQMLAMQGEGAEVVGGAVENATFPRGARSPRLTHHRPQAVYASRLPAESDDALIG